MFDKIKINKLIIRYELNNLNIGNKIFSYW